MNLFLVIFMLASTPASAAVSKTPCFLIQPFIESYGRTAVIEWARAHGITEAQISETIRRCEKKR